MTEILNPAASGALYPFAASDDPDNGAMMAWFEPDGVSPDSEGMNLVWASYDGTDWSAPELITAGENFFVNWADFPSLAGIGGAPMVAHWLQKMPGGIYAYHVNLAFRSESGQWSEPITPHGDRSATEHGFVSMVPLDQDRVFALWLDGYRTKGEGHDAPAEDDHGGHKSQGAAMTLHSVTVHRDGSFGEELEVDASVCDCCQTSMARSGNRIIAVYRDRSAAEIRDIYRAVFDLDDGRWSEPAALSNDGWEIAGCPVNGPQIAAHGDTVIAAWFTAVDERPRSYLAVSLDGGYTFGEPVDLDDGASIGRVGLAFNSAGEALLTWIGADQAPFRVYGRLWRNAVLGAPFVIGEIDGSRASGFPRVAMLGRDFLVAWTDPGPESRVRTVRVSPR